MSTTPTDFAQLTEQLKAKAEQWRLQQRLETLATTTEKTATQAVEYAAELAHTKREQVATLLDKAGAALDQRTEGRYAARVESTRGWLLDSLDKLAAKRPQPTSVGDADEPADYESAS